MASKKKRVGRGNPVSLDRDRVGANEPTDHRRSGGPENEGRKPHDEAVRGRSSGSR
jgi:hypothetical protein